MDARLLAYLRLVRAPAVFSALGDPVAGALVAGGRPRAATAARAAGAAGARAALCAAGMALNDYADRAEDARERPTRQPAGLGPAIDAPPHNGYVPERGHGVWFDFDPQAGREQAKRRPAIVLSPAAYNGRTSLALCCPVTSQVKGYPFEVAPPAAGAVRGAVLADQVRSLDWRARNAAFLDALTEPALAQVLARAPAPLT